jgi:hypothetical protein
MKQFNMFGDEFAKEDPDVYTTKIATPIYRPSARKPHIFELVDKFKTSHLIREIENSSVTDDEKHFLIQAAYRHNVFNYELIADYYAQASEEMQKLMERSALVIIDFHKAIANGYVKYSEEIADLYTKENEKLG